MIKTPVQMTINKVTWIAHRILGSIFRAFLYILESFLRLIVALNGPILPVICFVTAESAQIHFDSVVRRWGERERKSYRPVWQSGAISYFHPSNVDIPGKIRSDSLKLFINQVSFRAPFKEQVQYTVCLLLIVYKFLYLYNHHICKRKFFERNYIANIRPTFNTIFILFPRYFKLKINAATLHFLTKKISIRKKLYC